jgi:hypothetical protein
MQTKLKRAKEIFFILIGFNLISNKCGLSYVKLFSLKQAENYGKSFCKSCIAFKAL